MIKLGRAKRMKHKELITLCLSRELSSIGLQRKKQKRELQKTTYENIDREINKSKSMIKSINMLYNFLNMILTLQNEIMQ